MLRALPSLLLVGCSPLLVERCRVAAERAGLSVRLTSRADVVDEAERRAPLALVVPDSLYAPESFVFDALAVDVKSTIIAVDDGDFPQEDLDALLSTAIL